MKEYKYKEVKKIVCGKKHTVIIPEKHSRIDKLVFETIDLNAWDSYANLTNYHTTCLILKKGEKEWETLYQGLTRKFKINGEYVGGIGIYNILFQLETERVRNNFIKKAEIKELKDKIKRDSQRLKELEK